MPDDKYPHKQDCRADDPMDCAAFQAGEDALDYALEGGEECACPCHQEPA